MGLAGDCEVAGRARPTARSSGSGGGLSRSAGPSGAGAAAAALRGVPPAAPRCWHCRRHAGHQRSASRTQHPHNRGQL
ncbi:hypothetical protein CHLRE_13g602425v5 [Chlamydomonas reinhardtii]|uniref:Uncharacterized protein n=1 Tax=Chlamydomonas reinhardtii TaxID=3055 RepID=A0A2K3D1A6_CHLRE|nr:uncharacterized protein CHLRE_13g602425v5 [Chlamydomonas reinhardtii]PNW74310.1 hypothetical protein CHLRE_13g602425v5 [Chlamydomonas reinhardtii]